MAVERSLLGLRHDLVERRPLVFGEVGQRVQASDEHLVLGVEHDVARDRGRRLGWQARAPETRHHAIELTRLRVEDPVAGQRTDTTSRGTPRQLDRRGVPIGVDS